MSIPSVAKATQSMTGFTAGLKSRPFKAAIFSAAYKAQFFLYLSGAAEGRALKQD
jgi:hypothetical protein